ncbi:C2 domain-containing protein 5 isoform X1 [Macrobrachium rosenbergii]|uniref:C2 domain-containing protein 5 isoform X1 n=1 Tax=Macrobrachium rosenbergii TaxID=79674 RepID=UPI0034D5F996
MPGKVKVRVVAGRNLPVMDRSSDTTDAYVEVKLGTITHKTEVYRKSLNPQWNSEWFRFEVDDQELQDEPLQIRLMDHDTYSANDAIGKVYVDLNPLLLPPPGPPHGQRPHDPSQPGTAVMSGWLPVYDTMHGIRGEVNIVVKVDLFSDFNKFRQSSCGVQFFFTPEIPAGYRCQNIVGFVEELVVNDDPEYQWIDKIRTPRASNEARQTLFFKLSGELQRRIGLKVLELGGNAVIGYRQCFDLEGETGIVVRGLGSAVTLVKLHYDFGGTSGGTTHSPSPLREITAQRDGEDEIVLENMYVAVPNSDRPMPISVVHLPKKHSASAQESLSSLWFSQPQVDPRSSPKSSASIPSQYPPQWLDLMVNPSSDQVKPLSGQAALTNARRVLMGLPLVRRKRSGTVTQHPPVYLQRNSNFPHGNQFHHHHQRSDGGYVKPCKPKHSWPVPNMSPSKSYNWSGMHSINRGSKDSLKAGLKKTAQRMMRLRGSLEKSQSFDSSPLKANIGFIAKSASLKLGSKVQSPVGKLLGKSQGKSKVSKSTSLRESVTSPDDSVEDWDLDSPDVEVIGLEEEDTATQYSDEDDIGQEITSIEYSYKTLSNAFSDPTLNKSIYAMQSYPEMNAPLGPIQFISSDEDTCSSDPVSSDFSSPEHEMKSPVTVPTLQTPQKFYMSEEELTSHSSLESHFTGPVDVSDLHTSHGSFEIHRKGQGTPPQSAAEYQNSYSIEEPSRPVGQFDHFQGNLYDLCEPYSNPTPLRAVDELEDSSHVGPAPKRALCHERKSGINMFVKQSNVNENEISLTDTDLTENLNVDFNASNKRKAYELRPAILHVTSGTLPNIAVIPSSPVLPSKIRTTLADTLEENHCDAMDLTLTSVTDGNVASTEVVRDSEDESKSSATAVMSASGKSGSNHPSASKVNSPPPSPSPPFLHASYSDSLINPGSSSLVVTPSASGYLSSPSSSPSFQHVASSVSMDGDLLHCAVDVAAKCPSHPVYISSLDMLVDARPGSASMVGSPKRSSRSRHTSGCYPISRSPLPIDADGSKSESGGGGSTVGISSAAVNGGAPTHSPTHSGKLASPARTPGVSINRRSSDSDLSITPKGGSLAGSGGSSGGGGGTSKGGTLTGVHRPVMTQDSFDMLEYPFLTMKKFPAGFLQHLGGTVSARSVKLLDRTHTPEEVETRDNWWTQLRMEIRSHARALACNVVLGYEEFTTISDEVCVLNATGTAAVISLHYLDTEIPSIPTSARSYRDAMTMSLDRKDFEQQQQQQLQQQGPQPQSQPLQQQVQQQQQTQQQQQLQQGQQTQPSGKPSCKDTHSGSQACMSRSHPCIEDGFSGDSIPAMQIATSLGSNSGPILPQNPATTTQTASPPCTMCHVPYSETSLPFRVKISKCAVCRKGKVPDVLFTTLEPPAGIPITGRGCLIQARVARTKRDLRGELNAKEISDSLPFLEYELHKQLINKMRIKGMNALFSLRVRVTVGERLVVGIATATAVFLTALQPPPVPRVTSGSSCREDERRTAEVQKLLHATIARNKECYGTKHVVPECTVTRWHRPVRVKHQDAFSDDMNGGRNSDTEDSDDDHPEIDLSSGNKDTCVLELDDREDAEMIGLLVEDCTPMQLVTVSTQTPPGVPRESIVTNLQMFTRVWRAKVPTVLNHSSFNQYFDRLLQSVYFKVRKLAPCIIAGMQVNVELPEEDELQISLFGMVLGQGKPLPPLSQLHNTTTNASSTHPEGIVKKSKQDDGEMIFKMEELVPTSEENMKPKTAIPHPIISKQSASPASNVPSVPSATSICSSTSSQRSSTRSRNDPKFTTYHTSPRERYGVEITPLSYVPGGRIERHLGNLNFFFIRESTSIKESGGLSGFMGSFVTEVLALVRAHVAALGGNAMISYFMSECVLLHYPYKNQGQCLINVGGDVVQVIYNVGSALHDGTAEE